ncbi:RagB/SusD family nutrient uptake outer membrane protein [Alistipes sp.]|uniref:RagB/SusD family nutrient uptake outer membrane protein n=1 Tax=Alistipes sp. TaxID=1872444 RepID=UPI0025C67804|nr:RagB/SusD family nutrient uptake outer membrane protein [Alistipes sp.]
MKRLKICAWAAAALITLSGCEGNFDPEIYGSLFPGNFPSTEAEYESYAMTCYLPFTNTWTYYIGDSGTQHSFYIPEGGIIRMFDSPSDAMVPWQVGGFGEWAELSKANFNNTYYYQRGWVGENNPCHIGKLSQITRFTEIISQLEKASAEILSESKRKQLLGEVHICRGLMMYYLLHIYGPVPVVLNPDDVINDAALENLVRPTLDEMCGWITADFEEAIQKLPETVSEQGRYTADYARFCLMKHCLNEGSHMPDYYKRALEMYDELNTGKYDLFRQGTNPFKEMFYAKNDFSCEIIMALSCAPGADGSNQNGNFFPLMMLATPSDASKKNGDGSPSPFANQGGGWMRTPFNVAPRLYDSYDEKDLRREVIVTEYWIKADPSDSGTPTQKRGKEDLGISWDGYIINKFPIENPNGFQANDVPLARWADVLLMMAEADVRQSNVAPSAAAVQAVNDVRSRAGLDGLSAEQTASKDAFLDAILEERGKEFLYEGMRKIDLIRFNRYAQECYKTKKLKPTHQYIPLPNYIVEQAKNYGKTLEQTYSRPGWEADLGAAR